MTDTKIQGKFYSLQHEEWLRAYRKLALYSQRDVPHYIPTIDPHNQKVEINAGEIAGQLSIPGRSDDSKLALAQTTASEFGIVVTFEEV